MLVSRPSGRVRGQRNVTHASLLAGKLVDESGERLSPSHASSGDGRRRYYVSRRLIADGVKPASGGWRLPAVHVEETVASIVIAHLSAAGAATRLTQGGTTARSIADIDVQLKAFATRKDIRSTLALVERVRIAQGRVEVALSHSALAEMLNLEPSTICTAFLQREAGFQMRRRGVEARLVLGDDPVMHDPALLKFIARAHVWWEAIKTGSTLGQLAKQEGVTKRLIGLHLPAAFLAPDIVELVLAGRQPAALTAQALRTKPISAQWEMQRLAFEVGAPERNRM